MKMHNYTKLSLIMALSFCIMYGVMFLNVDNSSHIYLSLTRTYMSLLMIAPMAVLMVTSMPKMYPIKRMNLAIIVASILVFGGSLLLLRTQTPISDIQYMKAMIPHHSSAIMTSKNADLTDPEVKQLSQSIIESQEKEIELMKKIIARMDK